MFDAENVDIRDIGNIGNIKIALMVKGYRRTGERRVAVARLAQLAQGLTAGGKHQST
jgi:hypothetical protein